MNIEKKVIDEVSLQLTLSINEEDYKGRVDNALRSYRQKASIPGFRPGKAPASLIDKMYRKSAMAEEVNKLVPEMLSNYINENKLRVLGEPILAEGQELLDFEKDVNYTLTFDVALIPEYKVALDKNIKVAQYDITVDDKMIDETIKSYASRYGSYSEGDVVTENDIVKATVVELENGKEKEGGVKVEEAILSPKYLKDEDQKKLFIGAKKGAKLNISLKASMAGNEAEIASFLKIKKEDVAKVNDELSLEITSISHYTEAEVNQELFDKALGEGTVKNEAEFRAKIKEELQGSLVADSDYKLGLDVKDAILAKIKDQKFPDAIFKRFLKLNNKEQADKLSDEDFDKSYANEIDEMKWMLYKDAVLVENKAKIEQADVIAFCKKVAKAQFAQYGMVAVPDDVLENYAKEMMKNQQQSQQIVENIKNEKFIEIAKANISMEKKAISLDDFSKMFQNQ